VVVGLIGRPRLRGQTKKAILESRLSGPQRFVAARMMEIIDP
jgi:hypothetical protein